MRRLLSTVIFCVMGLAAMAQQVEPIVLNEITNVTRTSATANFTFNSGVLENYNDGDQTILGVCWGTSTNPTINDTYYAFYANNGGNYSHIIEGLEPGTSYYVRAFIFDNSTYTSTYSNELSFTTPCYENYETTQTVCSQYVYPSQPTVLWSEGFDDGAVPEGWSAIDANGDGYTWGFSAGDAAQGHNGFCISSPSYVSGVGALTPNNWLITPSIEVPAEGQTTLSWWTAGRHASWAEEHYEVYVSTTTRDMASFTSTIYEETLYSNQFQQRTVNLTEEFAGQTIYVAFVHKDCEDQYWLNLDDVELSYVGENSITESGDHIIFCLNDYGCVDTVTLHLTVLNGYPEVYSYGVSNVLATTANVNGEVFKDCGNAVTEKGFCYSTHNNPTIADQRAVSNEEGNYFEVTLSGLVEGTTYYVRAYATNSVGTAYGEERSFTTYYTAGVSGRVTDANTLNPIEGAYVSVFREEDSNREFVTTVVTGADGSYTVSDLLSSNYRFAANASGYERADIEQELLPGNLNTVNLSLTPEECRTPVNVDYALVTDGGQNSLQLTWDMPGDTMTQAYSSEIYTNIGWGSSYTRGIYHLFTPEHLAFYNGGSIRSVGAYFNGSHEYATYTIRIWTGGSVWDGPSSETPAYEQTVSNDDIIVNTWNDIPLNTPFTFDGTQCLWVGFHVVCNDPEGNPQYVTTATDGGNPNYGYGNVVYGNGYWSTLNLSYNWMIRAMVVPNSLTYNVQANGMPVASNVEGTSYTVSPYVPQQEQTCYRVTANCINGQVSEPSECATVQQTLPAVVTQEITNIKSNKVTVRGAVTSDGNGEITYYGFCCATLEHPTLSMPGYSPTLSYIEGSIEGEYTLTIENLSPQTTYYVRAFAINSLGTAYGNELVFTTADPCYEPYDLTVSDVVSSSAYLTWRNGNYDDVMYYELLYRVADSEDDWTVISNIFGESYLLTGLSPETSYIVYLRASCDEGEYSDYMGGLTFTTGCVSGVEEVQIGEEMNMHYYLPVAGWSYYSYSQQIYDASEINGARSIDRIEVQYNNGEKTWENVDIYMGHTSKSAFSNSSDWIPLSDLQLVYSGSLTFNSSGENYWVTIHLTNAFDYNGNDNLVLVFDNNSPVADYAGFYVHSVSENKSLYAYYSQNIDPSGVSGWRYTDQYRNNLRIPGACNSEGCERANVVARAVTDASATLQIAPVGSNPYELQYAVAGSDNYTTVANATGTSYTLEGLRQNTEYVVRVRSICGVGDTSDWKSAFFTTSVKRLERLYVTTTGTGDGSSWANAANDLAWTLNIARRIQEVYDITPEIWVAEGTYYGDGTDYTAFNIYNGMKLYGGFAGSESALSQRDVTAHLTILDGQNRQRVMTQQSASYSDTLVIDGFTFQNGYAANYENGGALRLSYNFRVRNCRFLNNQSNYNGGAVVVNGYYNGNTDDMGFFDCEFRGNTAQQQGGAVYDYNQYADYKNCTFTGNLANNRAGAVYGGHDFVNCLIANNKAYNAPAGMQYVGNLLLNCDIVGNTSIYNEGAGLYDCYCTMTNCVVWGNSATYNNIASTQNVAYCNFTSVQNCAVEGGLEGYDGVMNLASDNRGINSGLNYPYFVSPETGDYRLRAFSALVNAGLTEVEGLPATDLAGLARVYGDTVDVGCYENHEEAYCTAPYNLAVQGVTGNSAVVTWTNGDIDAPASYELSYKLAEDNDWTVVPNLTTAYYMLSGLQTQTTYEVRVRAICTEEMSSGYSAVLSFTTGCADFEPAVIIGENSTSSIAALPRYYYYSYSQQIYGAEEIGSARTIDTLYLQYYNSNNLTRNLDIYLGHTDKISFTSTSDWLPNDDLTLVFSGEVTFSNGGEDYWFAIPLNTAFDYNGTDNMVMAFHDNTGVYYTSAGFYSHSTGYYTSIVKYSSSSSTPVDISNPGSANYRYYYCNNLKLPAVCLNDGCSRASLAVLDVTETSANLVFAAGTGASGLELEYKKEGDENYTALPTDGNSLQLNNLVQNTDYEVRARSLCVSDTSSWTTVSFTTLVKNLDRLYVTTTGTGDGSSWANATGDLNWAANTAARIRSEYGTEADVWVAQGTYYGDGISGHSAFTMVSGVNVYGGFEGNEPADYDLSQRDLASHASILDGQNVQRVLNQSYSFDVPAMWDGFTIQNGYTYSEGGGAYLRGGITMNHCTFTRNNSNNYYGAGVYGNGTSSNFIHLLNCSFTENTCTYSGGGAYLYYAEADSCVFANNTANYGGGVYAYYSQVRNSTITQNTASYSGAGINLYYSKADHCVITHNVSTGSNGGGVYMYNYYTSDSYGLFNCLVANNKAYRGGGVYVSYYSRMDNTTIVNNQATYDAGGVYFNYSGSNNFLNNCVIWGNRYNDEVSNIVGTASMQNCAVEQFDESVNVSDNTTVVDLSSDNFGTEEGVYYPFFVTSDNGDYRLRAGSALINAGGTSGTVPSYDLSGLARVYDDTIDIGCYEFHGEEYCVPPFNLTAQDVMASSAVISWRNGNAGDPFSYELSYKVADAEEWTVIGDLHNDYYVLSGLQPQTDYRVRVRSLCDEETTSDYSLTTSFSTNCPGDYAPEVIIGTSTNSNYYLPMYHYYPYSYTQQIYLAQEVGAARTIDTLYLQYFYSSAMTRKFNIYLGHTDKEVFTGISYSNLVTSGLEKVFSGEFVFNNDGDNYWIAIPLQTPFEYNGSDNLVIAFKDSTNEGTYSYSNRFYSTYSNDGSNRSVFFGSYYEMDLDHLNYYYSSSYLNSRPNIRFQSICTEGCDRANLAVREVTDSSAMLSFVAGSGTTGYELEYCESGSETFIPLTPDASPYKLTGLTQNTSYDVRIRSLCSGDETSRWTTRTFTTMPKNLSRLYVTTTGTGDGGSWNEAASDLVWTLNTAARISEEFGTAPEVWVAKGTYYGDSISPSAFTMVEGVNVYGGFVGNEPDDYDLSQRDLVNNVTILDGQESQRVLYQNEGFSAPTTWDGFTIQHGSVNANHPDPYGGGAYLRANSTLRNCRIINNYAYYDGGGVYTTSNSWINNIFIEHCTISHNTARTSGGGVYANYVSIRYCDISYNTAGSYGGAVYYSNANSGNGVCLIANTLIANNSTYYNGAVYASQYNLRMDNLTIVNNTSTYSSGGCAGLYGNNTYLYNSIVWGNKTNGGMGNLYGSYICQNSAVEGMAVEGMGNIALMPENDGDFHYCPRFVRPSESAGPDDATESVDWHLMQGSVCVNRGDNDLLLAADSLDLDGNARIQADTIDMGCYESEYHAISLPEYGDIVYVKVNGSGLMDGTSWDNALPSLSSAILVAAMHDADVWVAQGTYYGDSVSANAFVMAEGVDVYGSFVGNEPEDYDLSQRDFDAHPTILDGQDNQRVLYQPDGFSTRTTWDGFTLQHGNVMSNNQNEPYGGGAYLKGGVTLNHCTITNNQSYYDGGGIYVSNYNGADSTYLLNCSVTHNRNNYNSGGGAYFGSKVVADHCDFSYNVSNSSGGGVYAEYSAVRNCTISHNRASYGGGIYIYYSTVSSSAITYNTSNGEGGGMALYYSYSNSVPISNCLVANNTSESYGAGIYSYGANRLNNMTIVNNKMASTYYGYQGAGVYGAYNSLILTNCIVWGNRKGDELNEFYGTYTANYVACDDACTGSNNVALMSSEDALLAPRFVNPSAIAGATDTTRNVDWHLLEGSPCINRGDNSVATANDLDGAARVQQDTIDLGCYESPYNSIALPEYGDIIYVVEGGAGTMTGESWENAIGSIKDAVQIAAAIHAKVWVAAGIYHGDGTSENAFLMKSGVDVYGGFAGNEPEDYDLSQRDFLANTSVLDGQYTQRVLCQLNDFSAYTAWDGFTIQNGRVNGNGAGVYMRTKAILRNCTVRNNIIASETYSYDVRYGAGVYASSNPGNIIGCTISNNGSENIANLYGGGLYAEYVKVSRTEISHNMATEGGGVYCGYYSSFDNCLINSNTASTYGGGAYINRSNVSFINCDIVKNMALTSSGGIYHYYSPTATNCIIWGNRVNQTVNNIPNYSTYTYCAIEPNNEGYTVSGTGNLTLASSNDGFDNTKNYVRFTDPESGDFRLHPTSSCANVGNNEVVTDTIDLYGNRRIISDQVDMGCSEVQDESSCLSVTNLNVTNITTHTAQVSWTSRGEESQWVVMYGEVGAGETSSLTVTEPTCQLTGLTLNRSYAVKVRALCDENMTSIFSIPAYFQTTCDPDQLDPLSEFSAMVPAENTIIYDNRVNFSWAAMEHATSYDFYLWKSTESVPANPSLAGLTQPVVSNYQLPGYGPGVTYNWKVVAWNECINKTSEVMTIQTNKLPDLHVTGINCSSPRIGQTLTVEWTVKNDGEGNTPPGVTWTDYIWLVHDADVRYYDSHDRNLLQIGNLQALNGGESYTNSAEVTIPTDIDPGNYFLFVFADQPDAYSPDFSHCPGEVAPIPYTPSVTGDPYPYVTGNVHFEGVVDETQNHDNFFYVLLTILPPPSPDLVVTAVTHTAEALSGHEANVTWTVTNQGEAAALGSWTDVVYLSLDTILDTEDDFRVGRFIHNGPLAIDESYQRTETFTVPVNYSGDCYFIVRTDNNNNIYEGLHEMNNKTISDAMRVTMSWFTDLQITDVTMPAAVDANGQYNCTFTVVNNGASPTNVSRWSDAVYISETQELDRNNATWLASSVHTSVLPTYDEDAPDASSYQVTVSVRIPAGISGSWYLHVVTDVADEVFEYDAENNNIYTVQPALMVLNPDLTVGSIELPDVVDPNEPTRIQWSVRNDGPGNVVNRSFTDKFYYNGTLVYTANVRDVNIPMGDSILRTATVQLPCIEAATAELVISTDVENTVLESVETNNSTTQEVQLSTPDLVVSEVTPMLGDEETLWSGTTAELTYTVTNNGTVAAANDHLSDKIYFSTSRSGYQASDLIYTNVHAVNLAVGESATYTCTVTLPNGISGNYYYHVVCNADAAVCESGSVANNESASASVEVMLSPSPDLVIPQMVAPDEVYLGAAFELAYTIRNQGDAAINRTVMQKFYYSMSPTAYDTAKLLATTYDHLNLAVNGEAVNVVSVTLPANMIAGTYFIHAVVDANDQVYEHNAENNNKKASSGIMARMYQLDLELTQIEGPDEMQWGQTAVYTLHIRNNSELPSLAPSWQDVVYLSSDDALHSSDQLMQAVRHTTVVEAGEEYEVAISVTIPYGTPSIAFLIGIADYDNANPDISLYNNLLAKQISVSSVPTPDLEVSEMVVLDDIYAGQPARLAYKVTNVSETAVDAATWDDKLFISYNSTYENIDQQLLNKDRQNMTLAQNEFYRDTLTFTVPLPYNGNLYLLMMTNAANNPYETVQSNNVEALSVNVVLPLPGDLVVTEVSCESSVVSGQMLHATWTIQNIGDNALAGRGLRSLVYISADTSFDANDRLLGSVTTPYINLGIDATMQQSLAGRISGLAAGNYYLIVKTDVTNAFNEVSDNNNTGCSVDPFAVTIRPLPFNENVYDTVLNDVVSDYMLTVGNQVNQTVRIHVNSEDSLLGAVNMIYATYNNMGSNLNYSYSTIGQYTANSELFIPATQPGYYGVNIYGSTPTNQPQNMIVRADILPFELLAVNDNHGGNTGVVTVELTGSRFRPDMAVCLSNGTETICADTLIYVNYYQAFAQFDLTGHTPGVYNVSAENFCEGEAVLANAFTIENGQPSGLAYNLLFPSSPRPNRSVVMMLEYGNIGNVDLRDQVLEITSVGGAPIALTQEGLTQQQTTLRVPLSIEGEPARLLRPGSYGSLNIYCYSSSALIFTIKPVVE